MALVSLIIRTSGNHGSMSRDTSSTEKNLEQGSSTTTTTSPTATTAQVDVVRSPPHSFTNELTLISSACRSITGTYSTVFAVINHNQILNINHRQELSLLLLHSDR